MQRDSFDTLGLAPTFDLSPAELQAAYLALSAQLHPDVARPAGGAGPAEVGRAMGARGGDVDAGSAALNAAKRELENPELRADLLLRRFGGPAKEQDRTLPPGFLAEMLEIRERIDDDASKKDEDRIAEWEEWAADRRKAHIKEVGRLFRSLTGVSGPGAGSGGEGPEMNGAEGAGAGRAAALKAIRAELNMWRYIERLMEQLSSESAG